jgi:DegV family protein with EDD domain
VTVRVVSDTACDLPDDVAESQGIELVPLHVRFGAAEFVDRQELSTKEFWARCAGSTELPQTSAPSPGAFTEVFTALAEAGATGVVCVTLSSKLSATNEAASQAARDTAVLLPVRVVDSLSATMGQGLVALAAAEEASRGADLDQVVATAVSARSRLSVFGAIDTLENLRKGGRIGGAAAAVGALLSIKPVVEVRGGVVEEESRQRTRVRSLQYLADKVRSAGPLDRLALVSANAPDFDKFVDMLADVHPTHPCLLGEIGPVIGAHAGPRAIGVAWLVRRAGGRPGS